jgi:hypothetical protein
MTFTSHVAGKNANVNIYTDRVEWTRRSSSEVIPIKHVSSVTVHRDGFRQAVKVICSGSTIDFRVGRGEAEGIKSVLVDLMLGSIRLNRPRRAAPRRCRRLRRRQSDSTRRRPPRPPLRRALVGTRDLRWGSPPHPHVHGSIATV